MRTWNEQRSVSSTDIIAPLLSNSPAERRNAHVSHKTRQTTLRAGEAEKSRRQAPALRWLKARAYRSNCCKR